MQFIVCKENGCVIAGGTADVRDVFQFDGNFDEVYQIVNYDMDPQVASKYWLKWNGSEIQILGPSNQPHPEPDNCSCH